MSDYTDMKTWLPLVRTLRWLGQLPVQIREDKPITKVISKLLFQTASLPSKVDTAGTKNNRISGLHLNFRFFSCVVLYTGLTGLARIAVWYISESVSTKTFHCNNSPGYAEWMLASDLSRNSTRAENVVAALAVSLLPIINILEWISLVCTASLFANFLNNWKRFNDLYPEITESNFNKVLSMRCTYLILLLPYAVYSSFGHIIRYGYGYISCTGGAILIMVLKSIGFQFIAQLEDAKVLFMLFASISGYFKIRQEFQRFRETVSKSKSTTSGEIETTLRKSLEAVRIVRQQTELICASQGPHELLYFTYMTFVVTFILFLTFAPLLRGATVLPLVIVENLGILALGMGRVYLKCHYAEQITIEENLLAEEVIAWNLSKYDIGARFEAKNLADFISLRPTKVVYGSLFHVNRQLMVAIGTQIITYMIILLQFLQMG